MRYGVYDRGDTLYVLTNEGGAIDFRVGDEAADEHVHVRPFVLKIAFQNG